MKQYELLLANNKKWAHEQRTQDPTFFTNVEKGQSPKFLWIGCSDSRVPANQITGTSSGEIFVHRNVANLVISTDVNLMSVLQYAVDVLKIPEIIVCGHYRCGGVIASMQNQRLGLIDNWIAGIKDTYHQHRQELNKIADPTARGDRLAELSVIQQVQNLSKTSIIQEAWGRGREIHIHGFIYALGDGILRHLTSVNAQETGLSSVYEIGKN